MTQHLESISEVQLFTLSTLVKRIAVLQAWVDDLKSIVHNSANQKLSLLSGRVVMIECSVVPSCQ